MPSSKLRRDRLGFSFLAVFAAVIVCTLVVSGVRFAATDALADADVRLEQAQGGEQRALLFPDAGSFEKVSAPDIEGLQSVYQADTGGYVFEVASDGYAGPVTLMVGIDSTGVVGVQIVSHSETDGIGTNALTEDYLGSFAGTATDMGVTIEDASGDAAHVDGVSGATFTSTAVIEDVNIAIEAYQSLGGN